ncbi:hypothetical protein C731_3377 [Mycolicibacterium hassiacum DSM 44199]|uniref:Uncharacterized protein n=1 Tax=Mycolicibacterium hassiacum (strain DSM 44199 / CIP 105218 / JCM 12690 / 3849) TaxID=1122247 RepID=K5BE25_MYCHD|nr:hypothetical protein C731_3377 [Mycolicibacterium hassiacum DSM 44199]
MIRPARPRLPITVNLADGHRRGGADLRFRVCRRGVAGSGG